MLVQLPVLIVVDLSYLILATARRGRAPEKHLSRWPNGARESNPALFDTGRRRAPSRLERARAILLTDRYQHDWADQGLVRCSAHEVDG